METQTVILRTAWRDAWAPLSEADVGALVLALLAHVAGEHVDPTALRGPYLPGMYATHVVQIDADRARYTQTCERRREAGRKGGEATAKAKAEAGAEVTPEPEEKPEAAPAPVPAKAEAPLDVYLRKTLRMTPNEETAWRAWYAAYPRHVAVREAARAWRDAVRSGVPVDALQAGAERYAREKAGTETRFIAHPATWIRRGSYADEAPKPSGTARLSGIAAAAARLDAEEAGHD